MTRHKKNKNSPKEYIQPETGESSRVEEPFFGYIAYPSESHSFKVKRAGKENIHTVISGFGHFIPSLKKVRNMAQVDSILSNGLPYREVEPIIEYLHFTIPDIARAASVSTSTVSRWSSQSSIGIPGAIQFFKIDQLIKKGLELFGSPTQLRIWLQAPCLALGNAVPTELLISPLSIELVDEALDALHYGNVM